MDAITTRNTIKKVYIVAIETNPFFITYLLIYNYPPIKVGCILFNNQL